MIQSNSHVASDSKQQDNRHQKHFQSGGHEDSDSNQSLQENRQEGRQQDNRGRTFERDRQLAVEAGRKGGQSQNASNNPGNFKNDPKRAAEAGRKGGQNSHRGRRG